MPLVSVIVPVHDAERYLPETLASIEAQTMRDFEVICVDDGSTDGSPALLEDARTRYGNLRVIRQENGGVSRARNTGMKAAQGRYLQFVDADDQVAPELLERVTHVAEERGAQMVIAGFDEFYGNPSTAVPRELCPDESLYQGTFSLSDVGGLCTEVTTPNVWRILYDRAFVEDAGVAFHEDLRAAEDLAFIYETWLNAERVALVGERLYHYRRDNAGSLTRGSRSTTGLRALAHVKAYADERGLLTGPAERQFVNLVLDTVQYALNTAAGREEFDALYAGYARGWRGYVGDRAGLVAPRYRGFYEAAAQNDAEGYLFSLYAGARDALERSRV